MLILIAGSRYPQKGAREYVRRAIERARIGGHRVVCGDAIGVDQIVAEECVRQGVFCTVVGKQKYPRNGQRGSQYVALSVQSYTKRDRYMCQRADLGLFVWNGKNQNGGTYKGFLFMKSLGKPAHLRIP